MNRRWSARERKELSGRMRAAWATGKFDGRKKMVHCRAWSAAEDAVLHRLAGTVTRAELVAAVAAVGLDRTPVAVGVRLKRLGLPCGVYSGLTARQVGALFGVDAKTVTHSWVPRGWITGVRLADDLPGAGWVFRDPQIEAFIREHGHAFDWRLMQPGRWRSLAEVLERSDPWLLVEQAATALGVKASTLRNHCQRGWIRSERRFEKTGTPAGRFVLRRSWLADFAYRRADLVGKCGRRAAA